MNQEKLEEEEEIRKELERIKEIAKSQGKEEPW